MGASVTNTAYLLSYVQKKLDVVDFGDALFLTVISISLFKKS